MEGIDEHTSGERLLAEPRPWAGRDRATKPPAGHIGATARPVRGEPATTAPGKPRGANWVAAYAMGLASAQRQDDATLTELAEAADGAPERLVQARERLQNLDDFDDGIREQAERLVTASLEQLAVAE